MTNRPDLPLSHPQRHSGVVRFLALLGLNLLASYLPALFWLSGIPGTENIGLQFLFSPVMLVIMELWARNLMGPTDILHPLFILAGFFCLLIILSFISYRSRIAMVAIPVILFVLSSWQGSVVAWLIRGIDAIGHS